ncbi:hypothetical protein FSP39_020462 [Pinctada imbricata]|uniref:ubiquitinyl hydrolase 1 n=1 Tax=Pinctada imbricata TaxID=66713 RepID=A0AA89BZT8_PINIB|nr:hypothetical protein FSP39_020462 [Pinctada imbricata]
MAEGGMQTDEYQRFIQQASNNFDDSGFFSIQVIDKALQVWGLNLVQYNSQDLIAQTARQNPILQSAYICNFRDHWFTVRKLGLQWFNLNSLLTGPELISDTYLSLFLTQLQQEGYSIFIVTGRLPECEADEVLRLAPAVQPVKPRLINENQAISQNEGQQDDEMQAVMEESRKLVDSDDKMLQRALQMSMEGYVIEPDAETSANQPSNSRTESTNPESSGISQPTKEELRLKRLAFLNKLDKTSEVDCDNTSKSANKSDLEDKVEHKTESETNSVNNVTEKEVVSVSNLDSKDKTNEASVEEHSGEKTEDSNSNGNVEACSILK